MNWLATDFEVLSGLLLFMLGMIALVFQMAVPAYIRTLIRRQHMMYYIWTAIFFTTGIVFFIRFSHSDRASLILAALVLVILFSLYLFQRVNSVEYVKRLIKDSEDDIRLKCHFDETLHTLIDIGRQSQPGFEKKIILDGLDELAEYILEEKYRLEPDNRLVKQLPHSVQELLTTYFSTHIIQDGAATGMQKRIKHHLARKITSSPPGSRSQLNKSIILEDLLWGIEEVLIGSGERNGRSRDNFRSAIITLEKVCLYLPDSVALETLTSIGSQTKSGFEKGEVLEALSKCCQHILDNPEQYDGTKLTSVIRSIKMVLFGADENTIGNPDNFSTVASKLRQIVLDLTRNHEFSQAPDITEAVLASQEMFQVATKKLFPAKTQRDLLKVTFSAFPREYNPNVLAAYKLRELGIIALQNSDFTNCVDILSKLLFYSQKQGFIGPEDGCELLGLIAHFWIYNEGGKMNVQRLLNLHRSVFRPSLEACLVAAITYHDEQSHFDTVGYLSRLRSDL